jgi:hypothetical protein
MVSLPETAAVGVFVNDAEVLWAPDPSAQTGVTLEAGQTARVLGLDESGNYYQIVWVGTYLWVPVGSLSPNPDEVWQNAPLPTETVD